MSTDSLLVEVDIRHLELLRATLNSAVHHNTVLDLADQYRKMSVRPQDSPMTKSLRSSIEIVEAYIEEAEDNDDGPGESEEPVSS